MLLNEFSREMKPEKRPLELIYVIDVSGSMNDYGKLDAVNKAMGELEGLIKEQAKQNPTVDINVRIITYGNDNAEWNLCQKVLATSFKFRHINDAYGDTPLGKALKLLNKGLSVDKMPSRSLPPVVVLLSDGLPNDDYKPELDKFLSSPWGNKAIKVAIALGKDADRDCLQEFTTRSETVLSANNVADLITFMRWTSTLIDTSHKSALRNDQSEIRLEIPMTMPNDEEF